MEGRGLGYRVDMLSSLWAPPDSSVQVAPGAQACGPEVGVLKESEEEGLKTQRETKKQTSGDSFFTRVCSDPLACIARDNSEIEFLPGRYSWQYDPVFSMARQ